MENLTFPLYRPSFLFYLVCTPCTPMFTYSLKKNGKRSGGRRAFALCHYNIANQKSDILHEHMISLKWRFYSILQNFFPTVLHGFNVTPPGILFYQTDIDFLDSSATYFWRSLGFPISEGQFIDEGRKLFFKTELSYRYAKDTYSDMIFVYHDKKIALEAGFLDPSYQILHEFCWDYACDIFKFQFLDILNNYYSKALVNYKHLLNKIKLKKSRIHHLLRLHYKFERDMDLYMRFSSDDIWKQAAENVAALFNNKTFSSGFDYTYFIEIPLKSMKKIQGQYAVLTKDFERKEAVLQHLENYKHETRNQRINYIMLFIAIVTLVLLIFPEWSESIALCLTNIWTRITSLFTEIKHAVLFSVVP